MPYANEHAARVRDPSLFQPKSYKSNTLSNGVRILRGRLKSGRGTMIIQTYRFPANLFTPAEARDWLKKHKIKYILFEAATGKEK